MIRYLLDTHIVSFFIKGINDGLIERMALGFTEQNIAIAAVTRGELRFGMAMMDPKDRRRRPVWRDQSQATARRHPHG